MCICTLDTVKMSLLWVVITNFWKTTKETKEEQLEIIKSLLFFTSLMARKRNGPSESAVGSRFFFSLYSCFPPRPPLPHQFRKEEKYKETKGKEPERSPAASWGWLTIGNMWWKDSLSCRLALGRTFHWGGLRPGQAALLGSFYTGRVFPQKTGPFPSIQCGAPPGTQLLI